MGGGIGQVELMLVVLVALAIYGVVVGLLDRGAGAQRRATAFARRAGLPEVTPELVRRIGRRRRFVVAGTVLGILATVLVDLWVVPIYAGLALGAATDAVTRPGPPPGTPRVAHATSTRVRDYVPAWLLGAAVAAAASVPMVALLWLTAPRAGEPLDEASRLSGAAAGWLVLAAGAGLATSLALARVVVRRRQPAGSPAALAVDDALRAQAVRDVLHLTAAVSFTVGWVLSEGLMEPDVTGFARRVGGAYPLVLIVGVLVVAFVHEGGRAPRHWRSRLEPVA
jgi:hypothetical protein